MDALVAALDRHRVVLQVASYVATGVFTFVLLYPGLIPISECRVLVSAAAKAMIVLAVAAGGIVSALLARATSAESSRGVRTMSAIGFILVIATALCALALVGLEAFDRVAGEGTNRMFLDAEPIARRGRVAGVVSEQWWIAGVGIAAAGAALAWLWQRYHEAWPIHAARLAFFAGMIAVVVAVGGHVIVRTRAANSPREAATWVGLIVAIVVALLAAVPAIASLRARSSDPRPTRRGEVGSQPSFGGVHALTVTASLLGAFALTFVAETLPGWAQLARARALVASTLIDRTIAQDRFAQTIERVCTAKEEPFVAARPGVPPPVPREAGLATVYLDSGFVPSVGNTALYAAVPEADVHACRTSDLARTKLARGPFRIIVTVYPRDHVTLDRGEWRVLVEGLFVEAPKGEPVQPVQPGRQLVNPGRNYLLGYRRNANVQLAQLAEEIGLSGATPENSARTYASIEDHIARARIRIPGSDFALGPTQVPPILAVSLLVILVIVRGRLRRWLGGGKPTHPEQWLPFEATDRAERVVTLAYLAAVAGAAPAIAIAWLVTVSGESFASGSTSARWSDALTFGAILAFLCLATGLALEICDAILEVRSRAATAEVEPPRPGRFLRWGRKRRAR